MSKNMLVLLSPAKKQNTDPYLLPGKDSQPKNLAEINFLVNTLKQYNKKQLAKLMSISDSLAALNYKRFQTFSPNQFNRKNAKPAIFTFEGDAYQQLQITDFDTPDLAFTQKHLMILSGLYGYLKPLDLIQPYRLEMKTPLVTEHGDTLYQFWGDKITIGVNEALKKHKNKTIINLASNEYTKAIQIAGLSGKMITIHFKEYKNKAYKTIGLHAKRARGMMTRYIMKNRIDHPNELKQFSLSGYSYNKVLSSENAFVFTRQNIN